MKKIFAISLGLVALVACNKETAETVVTSGSPIRFALSGEYTFTKATEAALEDNDEIQIIAGAPVNGATKATVASNALNLTTPLYWQPGQSASTDFVGLYPYTSSTATSLNYNLYPYNEQHEGYYHDYDYHKMFMTAHVASVPTDQSIVLPFKHPFSKVLVSINSQLGSDYVTGVVVKGIKMEATMDLVAETIDFGANEPVNVPATELAVNSYALIIMPQTAQPTIEVTTHLGSVYTFALASAFNFEAGKVSTASLNLESQSGGGATQGDPIGFGFSVTNWSAVETEPDFGQDNVAMGAYWYALGCLYTTDDTIEPWSEDFPMTYKGQDNNQDVWEIIINYNEAMAGDADSQKGFKFRKYSNNTTDEHKWDEQLGMWSSDTNVTMDINNSYGLANSSNGNKNIRFASAGNYKLTLTGNTLTVVKLD